MMIVGRRDLSLVRERYEQRSNQAIQYALDEIQQSALAQYVKHIYLYGSCARREQTYESDVDLLLILDQQFGMQENKNEMILDLKRQMSKIDETLPTIEIKVILEDSWREASGLFLQNVRKEGKELL